jgi:hypothetical protein
MHPYEPRWWEACQLNKFAGHVRLVGKAQMQRDIDESHRRRRRSNEIERPLKPEDSMERLWPIPYRRLKPT